MRFQSENSRNQERHNKKNHDPCKEKGHSENQCQIQGSQIEEEPQGGLGGRNVQSAEAGRDAVSSSEDWVHS